MAYIGIMPLQWLNSCGDMTLMQLRNSSKNVWTTEGGLSSCSRTFAGTPGEQYTGLKAGLEVRNCWGGMANKVGLL